MQRFSLKQYRLLGQASLIIIFFLINFMENIQYSSLIESICYALNYTLMVVGMVYVHYFLLLPLYLNRQYLLYLLGTFLIMSAFILLYYFFDYLLPFEYEEEEFLNFPSLIYDYLLLTLTVVYSGFYYFYDQWVKNASIQSALKNEKLQAELNFLKSQINPHFLFNTLNNIYAFAQTSNQKTAPMLEHLSSILRFMVYECSEDRVQLNKELEAIEHLLKIHNMKNSKQQNIHFSQNGVKGIHLVAPLILVNFVENACKHSDAVHNKDGFINVSIQVDKEDNCHFTIKNTYKESKVSQVNPGGIGLNNIKKRLQLQYASQHKLIEKKVNGVYQLDLSIPLERKS